MNKLILNRFIIAMLICFTITTGKIIAQNNLTTDEEISIPSHEEKQKYLSNVIYMAYSTDEPIFWEKDQRILSPEKFPELELLIEDFEIFEVENSFYFTEDRSLSRTLRVKFKKNDEIEKLMRRLGENAKIELTERIPIYSSFIQPNDPRYEDQWAPQHINCPEAWDITTGSNAIDVAVVDNAIDINHPDLVGNIESAIDVTTIPDSADPSPPDGRYAHGTVVAGIVSANSNNGTGVASVGYGGIDIMAIKAADGTEFNSNGDANITHGAEGIQWAVDNGAEIINASFGSESQSSTMLNAINNAWDQGIIVVAASGNENTDVELFPAANSNVIAVANSDDNDERNPSSNFGDWVDVTAPGTSILSTGINSNGYINGTGTSMSSPMVAGLLGLVWSVNTSASRQDVIDCVLNNTTPLNGWTGGGSGIINAQMAVQCAYDLANPSIGIGEAIGEVGKVNVYQSSASQFHTLNFERIYLNPVVVMGPVSRNGGDPLNIRVKNVNAYGCQFQIDEWDYLDGSHTTETIPYMVIEAGTHFLEDGTKVQAGRAFGVNHTWKTINTSNFSSPVVLGQCVSRNGGQGVTTRLRNVTGSSFQIKLQEEQGNDGSHYGEQMAWVVIEAGVNTIGNRFEMGKTPNSYTHSYKTINYQQSYSNPVFLGQIQTYDGSDPVELRARVFTSSSIQVSCEEERSHDTEINHTTEVIGYYVFDRPGLIYDNTQQGLVNDESCGAINLPVLNYENYTQASNVDASLTTNPGTGNITCPSVQQDVWFKAVMPSSNFLTIKTIAGSLNDAVMAVYQGGTSCNNMVYITCEDDNNNGNGSLMPIINLTGGVGNTIYIRIWGYGAGEGTFSVCALNNETINSQGVIDLDMISLKQRETETNNTIQEELKIYPNPADTEFNIEYSISKENHIAVEVFDLQGNRMLAKDLGLKSKGSHLEKIACENFTPGVYFVVLNGQTFSKTAKIEIF